jgi:hypothetical protein
LFNSFLDVPLMSTTRQIQFPLIVGAILGLAPVAFASPITTWRTFKASTATVVNSGQGTNAPVIGSTTSTSAASRIIGYFTPETLVSVGDKISLTFQVGFNDAVGVGNGGDNFRFALFDRNGESVPGSENIASAGSSDTNGFLGYWAGVMTGSGTNGSLRERFDTTNNDMFTNGSASANLTTPPIGGTAAPMAGQVNGAGPLTLYDGQMTLTRTSSGIDIAGSFSGNGGANTFAASDSTPISLTYGAVGFLNGGGISADQMIFQDVDATYTAVPEPPAGLLLLLAGGALALTHLWRRGPMKQQFCFRHVMPTLAFLAVAALAGNVAATEVTTWRTFKATTATVIDSGQGTNDPVIGNMTTTASATRIIGYFTPQSLVNEGDKISLTYTVSFNDAAGMNASSGDNWRYAIYDVNGETVPVDENVVSNGSTDTNDFLGYWAGVKTGAGAGAAGSLRERFDTTNNDMFANASATANLVSPPIDGDNIVFAGLVNGEGTPTLYTGELTITKTAAGVDLSGSFSGNGGANTFMFSETTPISLTYGAVGFLNGGGMSADQVILQDVNVTFTPAGAGLTGDFNHDNAVDGADLAQWQGAYGTTADADANGDGVSDGADFLLWQQNVGGAPAVSAVPEPTCVALAAIGLLVAAAHGRQKRRNEIVACLKD